jgi:protein-disulfide isomerase
MNDSDLPLVDVWCELQCPDCGTALADLTWLRAKYGDRLTVRLRHFPLARHAHAHLAAQAAVEAERQRGDVWPYATAVLARVGELATTDEPEKLLTAVAESAGLDADVFAAALRDGRHAARVDADHTEGLALGVGGTPTYVVAGTVLDGSKDQTGLRDRIVELLGPSTR